MLSPFPESMTEIVSSSYETLVEQLKGGAPKSSDLICYGDMLFNLLQSQGPAQGVRSGIAQKCEALLRAGIHSLQKQPQSPGSGIDLGLTYWQWAVSLVTLGKNLEAYGVLQEAVRSGHADSRIRQMLQAFPENKVATLSGLQIKWFFDPSYAPIPEALVSLPLKHMTDRGIASETLSRLAAAVIWDVSPDRKVWIVSFYDTADPNVLNVEGTEIFSLWFYQGADGSFRGCDVHK